MLSFNSSVKIFVSGDFNYYHEDWLSYSGGTGIVRTPTPPHPHPIFFSSFIIFIFGNYISSWHLACPAADDDFVLCQNICLDKCLCCQANIWCILQLMVTLLNYLTLCEIVLLIWKKKKKLFLLPPKFF